MGCRNSVNNQNDDSISDRHLPKEMTVLETASNTNQPKGIVGLKDMGNTSYMNSIIQCLAQSPQLVQIFLKDDYEQDWL